MGVLEQVKGLAKRVTGDALGDDDLKVEGQAQQSKGVAQTKEKLHETAAAADNKAADELERDAKRR